MTKDLLIQFVTPIANITYDAKKGYVHMVNHAKRYESVEDLETHAKTCSEQFSVVMPYPLLLDIRAVKGASKDVRDFAAKNPYSAKQNKCMAVIVGGGISKIVGNLALRFSKPRYPTRLFTKEEKAIEWLMNN